MSAGYYIKRGGKLFGPFSLSQAASGINRDFFTDGDLISEDQIRWEPIADFRDRQDLADHNSPRNEAESALPDPSCFAINEPLQPIPLSPPKKRMIYIMLGMFLGGFGIHNFYAGYSGRGISQLLITLFTLIGFIFVWIWVLVEICTVEVDAKGVRMI